MDGILALWKERGMTSHDCVFKLRKLLQTKKIGHGGTLDPEVDGVLPIGIGKGTKILEYLTDTGKAYQGEITLGKATTTEDAYGEIIAEKKVLHDLDLERIDQAMKNFIGTVEQIPPMYSAVKVNGKRLYEYARAGETVERPVRQAVIHRFERTSDIHWDEKAGTCSWSFNVLCGKGTYVRTLAVDTGSVLGYPAFMSKLTRTVSAGIESSQCLTLTEVGELMEKGEMTGRLLPLEKALPDFPKIDLSDKLYSLVRNGGLLTYEQLEIKPDSETRQLFALCYMGQLTSIYGTHPSKENFLKPVKVLRNDL